MVSERPLRVTTCPTPTVVSTPAFAIGICGGGGQFAGVGAKTPIIKKNNILLGP